jgi:hypothetical protein
MIKLPRSRSSITISPAIQKTFLVLLVASYAYPIATVSSAAIQQYSTNPNLSGFMTFWLQAGVAPIAFYATAYLLSTRHKGLSRWFIAGILCMMGTALSNLTSLIWQQIPVPHDSFESFLLQEVVILIACYGLFVAALLLLRRRSAL